MDYVLLGPPGCGKGTQAQLLALKHQCFHLCAGDLLRLEIQNKTDLGKEAEKIINQGDLVSDTVISHLVAPYVYNHFSERCILYDGYPRSVRQGEDLDLVLQVFNRSVTKSFWFEISDEALVSRIQGRVTCQDCRKVYHSSLNLPHQEGVCDRCFGTNLLKRADDDVSILKKRLSNYYQQTKPVMEYYKNQGKLILIDADQSIEKVSNGLSAHISEYC
jgi:adenylate kinase